MSSPHRVHTKRLNVIAWGRRTWAAINVWGRFVCLGLVVVCGVVGACNSTASPQQHGKHKAEADEFLLTVTPFENPVAVSVLVRGDGESEVVQYSPAQIAILDVRRGRPPEALLVGLRARAAAPGFRAALSRAELSGEGFEEGDLFQLTAGPGGVAAAGLLHKAPPEVRDFIKDLLSLGAQLGKATPAEAYVRGAQIDPERLASLRRRGQIRITPLDDFPTDLRPALTKAVEQPLRFHPLSQARYDRLLTHSSQARQLFITVGDAGHELTLYHARR